MKQNFEYIVLGLGGIGSAAAYWLARRAGQEVLGLEQFEIGHVRGGSQDHSRIIRLSYHNLGYIELAKAAYRAWATVEAEAQDELVVKTGGLDLSPPDALIPISDYIHSMQAASVPFETLDAAEVMYRWPQFQLTDDITALYQAESGLAAAAKGNAAHLRLAADYGATLADNMPVSSLRTVDGEIEVVAGGKQFRGRHLIITAGAWSNQALAHFGLNLPLTVTKEQVTYFSAPRLNDFMPERFPIWIWMDEPCYYGFPIYGEAGVKVAQDAGGEETTADTRTFEPDQAAVQRVEDFMRQYLPTALGPKLYTKTCLYTMPPDRDFIIDSLPNQPNVTIAIGAGHAFKFASVLGKTLSDLAIDNATPHDLTPFRINRPILLEKNPVKNFMV